MRVRAGQLHFLRRPKILDPEDVPPSMRDAIGWGEHDWEEPEFDGGA